MADPIALLPMSDEQKRVASSAVALVRNHPEEFTPELKWLEGKMKTLAKEVKDEHSSEGLIFVPMYPTRSQQLATVIRDATDHGISGNDTPEERRLWGRRIVLLGTLVLYADDLKWLGDLGDWPWKPPGIHFSKLCERYTGRKIEEYSGGRKDVLFIPHETEQNQLRPIAPFSRFMEELKLAVGQLIPSTPTRESTDQDYKIKQQTGIPSDRLAGAGKSDDAILERDKPTTQMRASQIDGIEAHLLEAVRILDATTEKNRVTCKQIVKKAIGPYAEPNTFKKQLAAMVKAGTLKSIPNGRGAGYWLGE